MEPALRHGDRFLINCLARESARGDIVLFHITEQRGRSRHVYRVVAFDGELVRIDGGNLYLNGPKWDHPLNRKNHYYSWGQYATYDDAYLVPPDSIFVLGDNSSQSRDSRYLGAIPLENVQGVVYKIWWPPGRAGLTRPIGPPQ
jgi:signal peptidase I